MDSNEDPTTTRLLVCGVTYSASFVFSTNVNMCTSHAVPFVASIEDSTVLSHFTFFAQVSYPSASTEGAFTDVQACKMVQRSTWTGSSSMDFSVLALKYQALST